MKLLQINRSELLNLYAVNIESNIERPLIDSGIKAGFPSPAEDFSEISIDLNHELIKNPSSTFFAKVSGDSMKDMGIHNGDMLVIDKSLEPVSGKVAVCYIDGEFTLKQIKIEKDCCWLVPANNNFSPICVTKENDFIIWGIVTYVIKQF